MVRAENPASCTVSTLYSSNVSVWQSLYQTSRSIEKIGTHLVARFSVSSIESSILGQFFIRFNKGKQPIIAQPCTHYSQSNRH